MKSFLYLALASLIAPAIQAQNNVGIGVSNPTNKLEVLSTVTAAPNATIYGTNTSTVGSAVYGVSNASGTQGVNGSSESGIGVYGSSNYIALSAGAITGTALYASSFSGIGLQVSGKIKLSGGDTNPSDGAILTSDAVGNAVWKPKKIGFFANTAANTSIPISTFRKVEFSNEDFDMQNNFVPYSGTTTPSTSVFTAPVAGVYHFASSVIFQSTSSIQSAQIRLIKNASSTVIANHERDGHVTSLGINFVSLEIEGDFYLAANDRIWVEVAQRNILEVAFGLSNIPARGRFSGYLKIAD